MYRMRAIISSSAAKKCMVPWMQPPVQRRPIFSEAYLNIDKMREKRALRRGAAAENGHFIRAARKDFDENGVRNMLITDTYQGSNLVR